MMNNTVDKSCKLKPYLSKSYHVTITILSCTVVFIFMCGYVSYIKISRLSKSLVESA